MPTPNKSSVNQHRHLVKNLYSALIGIRNKVFTMANLRYFCAIVCSQCRSFTLSRDGVADRQIYEKQQIYRYTALKQTTKN